MKLKNETYDVLKWLCLICIPALATCYSCLAGIWGWPYANEIAHTATACCTFLGALLGISTAEFRKNG